MIRKKYEKVYLENKEKINEWEKTLKEDEERKGALEEQRVVLDKERETTNTGIKEKQIIVNALRSHVGTSGIDDISPIDGYYPEEYTKKSDELNNRGIYYVLHGSGTGGRVYNATMKKRGDFYYLLEGSLISPNVSTFKGNTAPRLRETHKTMITKGYKVKAPIPFPSPTAAATFVIGYSSIGKDVWIEPNSGLTLSDYEKQLKGGK